jgi:hypothetical protein
VWELSVIDDCNTDGEVGNKECERLSGVVCNPTSTAIAVQLVSEVWYLGNCHTRIRFMSSERKTLKVYFHARVTRIRQLVTFGELSNNVDTTGTGSMRVHVTCELERDSPKVNMWACLMHKLLEPFFSSEKTVTGRSYLDMLELYALPQFPPQTISSNNMGPRCIPAIMLGIT